MPDVLWIITQIILKKPILVEILITIFMKNMRLGKIKYLLNVMWFAEDRLGFNSKSLSPQISLSTASCVVFTTCKWTHSQELLYEVVP